MNAAKPRLRVLLLRLVLGLSFCLAGTEVGANLITRPTYQLLTEAQELIAQQAYDKALQLLESLHSEVRNNTYEAAVVAQNMGYVYSAKGDYARAAEALRQALASNALPREVTHSLRYDLAQLQIALGEFNQAVGYLESWLAQQGSPSPEAEILAATAYFELKRYDAALAHAERAIAKADEPQESWYQLLVALYYERSEYDRAVPVLEQLVSRFPTKKLYWLQLANVYQMLQLDDRALATMALANQAGQLEARELLQLTQLYLHANAPYEAAKLLESAIGNGPVQASRRAWNLLADSWLLAREPERALDALARAAELARDGEPHLRRAEILIGMQRWDEAGRAVEAALMREELERPQRAHFLQGVVRYEAGNLVAARAAFERASSGAHSERDAERWLEHIEREWTHE
jgi:tetratricopeptide (TPR) repeat protein